MARQENVWLLFEQVRLGHLMVEATGRVVEVLVSEQVDVDAALAFIHLGNLGRNDKVSVLSIHEERITEIVRMEESVEEK